VSSVSDIVGLKLWTIYIYVFSMWLYAAAMCGVVSDV
jgi:hypothetical protein